MKVQIEATYLMYGDLKPEPWADVVLGYHKEAGDILDYKFIGSETRSWGIEKVRFYITIEVPDTDRPSVVKDKAETMICGFVNDSDVEIVGMHKV